MKTAISVPDDVFERAERLARRRGLPRSRLYSRALEEYLDRHDPEEVTGALDRVCQAFDARPDPALAAAAQEVLRRTEW